MLFARHFSRMIYFNTVNLYRKHGPSRDAKAVFTTNALQIFAHRYCIQSQIGTRELALRRAGVQVEIIDLSKRQRHPNRGELTIVRNPS